MSAAGRKSATPSRSEKVGRSGPERSTAASSVRCQRRDISTWPAGTGCGRGGLEACVSAEHDITSTRRGGRQLWSENQWDQQ